MALTLLLGGARSGKSALAVALAGRLVAPVTFLATAEALDEEFAERIELHRAQRPAHWRTLEAPLELEAALAGLPTHETVIIDCLTLWVANLQYGGSNAATVQAAAEGLSDRASTRAGLTLVVSNEVGSGIVPANAGTRAYRDLLGQVNALFASRAAVALLVVAGRALRLGDPLALLSEGEDRGG